MPRSLIKDEGSWFDVDTLAAVEPERLAEEYLSCWALLPGSYDDDDDDEAIRLERTSTGDPWTEDLFDIFGRMPNGTMLVLDRRPPPPGRKSRCKRG